MYSKIPICSSSVTFLSEIISGNQSTSLLQKGITLSVHNFIQTLNGLGSRQQNSDSLPDKAVMQWKIWLYLTQSWLMHVSLRKRIPQTADTCTLFIYFYWGDKLYVQYGKAISRSAAGRCNVLVLSQLGADTVSWSWSSTVISIVFFIRLSPKRAFSLFKVFYQPFRLCSSFEKYIFCEYFACATFINHLHRWNSARKKIDALPVWPL